MGYSTKLYLFSIIGVSAELIFISYLQKTEARAYSIKLLVLNSFEYFAELDFICHLQKAEVTAYSLKLLVLNNWSICWICFSFFTSRKLKLRHILENYFFFIIGVSAELFFICYLQKAEVMGPLPSPTARQKRRSWHTSSGRLVTTSRPNWNQWLYCINTFF